MKSKKVYFLKEYIGGQQLTLILLRILSFLGWVGYMVSLTWTQPNPVINQVEKNCRNSINQFFFGWVWFFF